MCLEMMASGSCHDFCLFLAWLLVWKWPGRNWGHRKWCNDTFWKALAASCSETELPAGSSEKPELFSGTMWDRQRRSCPWRSWCPSTSRECTQHCPRRAFQNWFDTLTLAVAYNFPSLLRNYRGVKARWVSAVDASGAFSSIAGWKEQRGLFALQRSQKYPGIKRCVVLGFVRGKAEAGASPWSFPGCWSPVRMSYIWCFPI